MVQPDMMLQVVLRCHQHGDGGKRCFFRSPLQQCGGDGLRTEDQLVIAFLDETGQFFRGDIHQFVKTALFRRFFIRLAQSGKTFGEQFLNVVTDELAGAGVDPGNRIRQERVPVQRLTEISVGLQISAKGGETVSLLLGASAA